MSAWGETNRSFVTRIGGQTRYCCCSAGSVINGPTTENSPINPSGEATTGKSPEPSAATLALGEQSLAEHAAETGKPIKRERGRPIEHGRYSKKAKQGQISVGKMVNGSEPVLLEENQAPVPQIGTEAITETFDAETSRAYAALIVNLLVEFKGAKNRRRIFNETGNASLASFVQSKRTIDEKPRESLEIGLVGIAKKYKVNLGNTPEGLFAGGLLLWISQDSANTKTAIEEYFKMRPEEKPK